MKQTQEGPPGGRPFLLIKFLASSLDYGFPPDIKRPRRIASAFIITSWDLSRVMISGLAPFASAVYYTQGQNSTHCTVNVRLDSNHLRVAVN